MEHSPRAVHNCAIYQTKLIYGIQTIPVPPKEVDQSFVVVDAGHRYHIRSICSYLAKEFCDNKGADDFIPTDPFSRLPIQSICTDTTYVDLAKREFEHLNVKEQMPEIPGMNESITSLAEKLVEAFNQSILIKITERRDDVEKPLMGESESERIKRIQNFEKNFNADIIPGELTMQRMKQIRDDVFMRVDNANRGPAPAPARAGEPRQYDPLPGHQRNESCGPKTVLGLAVTALGLWLVSSLWEPPKKEEEQKVTHFSPKKDISRMQGGDIYA